MDDIKKNITLELILRNTKVKIIRNKGIIPINPLISAVAPQEVPSFNTPKKLGKISRIKETNETCSAYDKFCCGLVESCVNSKKGKIWMAESNRMGKKIIHTCLNNLIIEKGFVRQTIYTTINNHV